MGKKIVIANQKGGVGKTTTATALASGLNMKGYKTLLVDTDPQGNASDTYGAQMENTPTIYDVFTGSAELVDTIQTTSQGDVVPGDIRMSGADMQFTQQGREYRLRKALSPVAVNYEFIIIDTPPALGIITINALTTADSLIIPMIADRYSLQGIRQLSETIETVREYSNPDLMVNGILLTRYNSRTVLNRDIRDVIEQMAESWHTKVYETTIRQSISLQESQTQQESIFSYAPTSITGQDYQSFVDEFLKGVTAHA